jgi:hypothetical protein
MAFKYPISLHELIHSLGLEKEEKAKNMCFVELINQCHDNEFYGTATWFKSTGLSQRLSIYSKCGKLSFR